VKEIRIFQQDNKVCVTFGKEREEIGEGVLGERCKIEHNARL